MIEDEQHLDSRAKPGGLDRGWQRSNKDMPDSFPANYFYTVVE
jgi:hypothetical protein